MKNNATSHLAQAESNAKTLLHCKNTSLHNGGMTIKETLAAWFTFKNTNATEIARKCGNISQSTIHRILTGESPFPRAATLNAIADALGIGYEQIYQLPEPYELSSSAANSNHANETSRSYDVRRVVPDRRDLDLINIPMLDTCASMGIGCLQPAHDDVITNITAHLSSLRRHASFSSPDNLALITGYGDSMEGTFNDGDLLLVDRGVLETKLDAVYVLALDGELYIKRIQRRPNGDLLMISDNKKYEPYVIESSKISMFQVLGRVILAWNARKL